MQQQFARFHMRIVERLAHGVDRAARDVVLEEKRHPLGARAGAKHHFQLLELALPRLALGELVGLEFGYARQVAKACPEVLFQRAQRYVVAVAATEDAVAGGAAGVAVFAAAWVAVAEQRLGRVVGEEGHGRIHHGDVHHLALSGRLARQDSRQDGPGSGERGPDVRREQPRHHGRPAGLPEQRQRADDAHVVQVVTGHHAVGTVLAVTGDGAVDESRVKLAQRLETQAQTVHYAGAKALHQHVGGGGQFAEDALALLALEVEGKAALVAVAQQEDARIRLAHGRKVALVVAAARLLHLEHFCTQVAQHLGAQRRWQQPTGVQNAQTLQGGGSGGGVHGVTSDMRAAVRAPSGGRAALIRARRPVRAGRPSARSGRLPAAPLPGRRRSSGPGHARLPPGPRSPARTAVPPRTPGGRHGG